MSAIQYEETDTEKACKLAGVDPDKVVCTITWRVEDFMDALLNQHGMTVEQAAKLIDRFTRDDMIPSYPKGLETAQENMGRESLDTLAFEVARG